MPQGVWEDHQRCTSYDRCGASHHAADADDSEIAYIFCFFCRDTMTQTTIQKIIDELCAIEPSFGEHIDEVRAIVSQMCANQPDIQVDKAFVAKTRDALQEHIAA